MLSIPERWQVRTGGGIALDLLRQVKGKKLQFDLARGLIEASLDLMVATLPRRGLPPRQVETVSSICWCVSDLYYVYLPDNCDFALRRCIKLARSSDVVVVAAQRFFQLKRRLLDDVLKGRKPPVSSFDAFVSWHITSATIDHKWSRGRSILELLSAYNRRVLSCNRNGLILVELLETLGD